MDQLNSELKKLHNRQQIHYRTTIETIDSLLSVLNECSQNISTIAHDNEEKMQCDNEVPQSVQKLQSAVQSLDAQNKIIKQQKEFHGAISKFIRSIEKSFCTETESICRSIEIDQTRINDFIMHDLFQRGRISAARALIEETKIQPQQDVVNKLIELNEIVNEICNFNLVGAKRWTQLHSEELKVISSTIEFNLMKAEYISIILGKKFESFGLNNNIDGFQETKYFDIIEMIQSEALNFAQTNFPQFFHSHPFEIQQLMGCLVWVGDIENSPYSELMNDEIWSQTANQFISDGCKIYGLPQRSLLYTCIAAGTIAIPKMLKMVKVVSSSNQNWHTLEELPAEISLPNSLKFHSIFSCPVTRDLASEQNPAVLLVCGHVICKNSVQKILRRGNRFKCPTCPVDQTPNDVHNIFF